MLLPFQFAVISFLPMVTSECLMTMDTCEFYLDISHRMTMMLGNDLVFPANRKLYKYDVVNTSQAEPIPTDAVISADGWREPRLLAVVNGTLPGPTLTVYEDQTLVVHVKNNLRSDAVTIHWHGMHLPGTPWMDGMPYVTQCPILPGQSFRYEFKAKPRGTFWYHSHMGFLTAAGVYGALVIRERTPLNIREHIIQIQDWSRDTDIDMIPLNPAHGIYREGKRWVPPTSLDGSTFMDFNLRSVLFNGRGRIDSPTDNQAPLEVFPVIAGLKYRFRVIGAVSSYPVRVSIDNHMLNVTASDGYDIEPITVESFVIQAAERYDFEIITDQSPGNYWIRGLTLEIKEAHQALAILRYDSATDADPTTFRTVCTQASPCVVLNCPFKYYPEAHTVCRSFDEIKAAANDDPAPPSTPGKFQEFFLNFATIPFPTVNGIFNVFPNVNLMAQPNEWQMPCSNAGCGVDKSCFCTHLLEIGNNDTIQLVLFTMGGGRGKSHPIHLHGHAFYVVKMGFGRYDETTGMIEEDNLDIDCGGNPDRDLTICNNARWSNSSWLNGNVPGMELLKPPRKDTLAVPTGGYAVVRFIANNPGLWGLHCHMAAHGTDGMALILNVSFSEVPKPPLGFPECHSYPRSSEYFTVDTEVGDGVDNGDGVTHEPQTTGEETYTKEEFWAVFGTLIAVVIVQFLVIVGLCGYYRCGGRNEDGQKSKT